MENPAYVIGIPLLVLGAIGFGIYLLMVFAPDRALETAGGGGPTGKHAGGFHPTPREYFVIGVILAVITAIEITLYYAEPTRGVLIALLLTLSSLKFIFVVLWYMHLKFDSRFFSTLFGGGLALAVALFLVVLVTIGRGGGF
jgi:cytochrome c oxidase subunit IV